MCFILFPFRLLHSAMDSLELFSFCLENFQLSFCYLFLIWFHCQRHTLYGFMGVFGFFFFFNLLSLALDIVFLWLLPWSFEKNVYSAVTRWSVLLISVLISSCWSMMLSSSVPLLISTNFWERDVEVSNFDSGFSVSPFSSVRFWLSYLQLCCLVHTHLGFAVLVFWGFLILLTLCNIHLSLW